MLERRFASIRSNASENWHLSDPFDAERRVQIAAGTSRAAAERSERPFVVCLTMISSETIRRPGSAPLTQEIAA